MTHFDLASSACLASIAIPWTSPLRTRRFRGRVHIADSECGKIAQKETPSVAVLGCGVTEKIGTGDAFRLSHVIGDIDNASDNLIYLMDIVHPDMEISHFLGRSRSQTSQRNDNHTPAPASEICQQVTRQSAYVRHIHDAVLGLDRQDSCGLWF